MLTMHYFFVTLKKSRYKRQCKCYLGASFQEYGEENGFMEIKILILRRSGDSSEKCSF
ncbi:hypothetical protein LINGRAHAP2_LOCUS15561 [Linum grandiflorum]